MLYTNPFVACYANDNDALIPELWARESIAVLEENMVMGMLVHRDFSMEVADYGDVVNTRKPSDMKVQRKTDSDTISYNDAVVTNVQVPLNQHFYCGFVIKDGERSKSMQDLIEVHLVPAMKAMGNGVDRAIVGQMAHELIGSAPSARVGRLLALSSSNAKDYVLESRELLNRKLAYTGGRRLVLAPGSETSLLQTELFIAANQRGDGGSALEEARLGRILGFDTFMDQNVNGILASADRDTAAGATTAAIAAGSTGSLTAFDVTGYVCLQGEYAVLAGNDQPNWLTAVVAGTADTTAATLNEATKYAVASGAVITVYKACDVDGDYAVGYTKGITLDGFTANKGPVVGQLVSFGNTAGTRHTYTVIEVLSNPTTTSAVVLLDRPLAVAVADNAKAYPGPAGDFNVAFHRNAVALVSRPLARPRDGEGARSFVASHNGIAMRATMQYDIDAGGTKVVLDLLAGVKVLDSSLAVLMLG